MIVNWFCLASLSDSKPASSPSNRENHKYNHLQLTQSGSIWEL